MADPFGWTRKTERDKLDALFVTEHVAYVSVPDELLMDYGIIPDTRPALPPLAWHRRLRRHWPSWRERLAYRAFKVIAGYEVPEE